MSNEPDIDPGGQRVEGDEAHECYSEHVDPSSSGEVVGNPTFPQYMVTDDNEWVQPLSHVVYEDVYQFQDLHNVGQHLDHTEEVYLLNDAERDMERRNSVESLQVAANEVVIDDMLGNTVEPQQYVAAVPEEVVPAYPQQQFRSNSNNFAQTGRPRHIETIPGGNRVQYIVQNSLSTLEMQPNHSVQYEVRPAAMFEGPSNQPIGEPPHNVPVLRSRSKSQPRRPLYGELEDESLAYLVQEYDEGEWDGVELEDHEYFIGGPDEREAIILAGDRQEQSNLRPPKTIQRPYFPPNLSPTEKKEYLLVNYKKACDRYFPFANVALLEADTRYKPVEAFASDLYRFHSRGAHIHGFFRTVIDTRDRPSHDQTRYIQDIQFGKVFPLFPDYEEWDGTMRSEFRQLSNRLMQIFERKCFYANTGSGHGRAPIIRRGPKPTQKPPPDYAEQQRIQYKGIPRGFQPLRSSIATQMKMFSTKPTSSHSPFTTLPGPSMTTLKPLAGDASTSEPVVVPHDLGTPRLEAYEHNKRVSIKRLVNNAFVNREQVSLQCEEPVRQTSSVSQSLTCRIPDGPSKTLRHQRSTASKAIRMIANRTIEPAIDLATGRYVVSLDELRGLDHASTERQRYVQRPLHTLREMADSARRGGGSYNWTPGGRPQAARISRIDQAPRFTHNSTAAASSTSQQNFPFNYGAVRAPLLTNVPATEVTRRPGVLTGNALTTTTSSLIRSDHVYPRSHSSGRREAPASNYRRSASSGRPATQTFGTNSVPALEDRGCTSSEQILVDLPTECMPTSAPATEITDENQSSVQQVEKCSASLTNKGQSQLSDQNNSPRNTQGALSSRVTSSQKPQKDIVLLRDEHGQLRRVKRLPDGTLLIRDRPPGNLISQLGRISTETRSGAEVRRSGSPKAGTVWDVQSIVGKQGKKIGKEVGQWRRSQAFPASWNHSASVSEYESALHNHNSQNSAPITQPKAKSKRKDVLYPDDDNEIIVITGKKREKHVKILALPLVSLFLTSQRIPKLVSRLTVVNHSAVPEEQKAGRPPKKFRGRLAKQKQAIRDAEIAEKVAIKQRELPVLDLTLKVIEDPTVELPLEATILLDSSIIHDTALLHEVGEVLKELVAQVCLEELQPKRDKYRQAVLERAKQQSGEGTASNIRNVRPSVTWESKPLNTSQEEVAEIQIGGSENVAHCSNHDQSPSLCSKSQWGMRNAWEEDFAFSALEDFDLNEDDLVDINVDTFFTSAENIDTSSGDEGDTPSHKMRQKLRTFLGEVVHFPRVTSTRVDSSDHEKISTETSSTETSKSLGIKEEHVKEDQAEDDVGRVAAHVIDIIIDQISSWICQSLDNDDKRTEQKTYGDQFTHFRESSSFVSVVLSLEKSESSGTALQKITDTDMISSFRDDYGNCYRHIRFTTSVIPELKTSSLHNAEVDDLDFPFNMSAIADLSMKDVDVRLDNISSEYPVLNSYLTSDDVTHIQTAEHHSSKENLVLHDIEYSSYCDIVFFEAIGEEECYSVSGAVNIAAVGAECLNLVCDVSINLSHTEFICNHVEERCFDVQKNFTGFTYSSQQCMHSIRTMDTNFSGNDEHLQVSFSLLCANAEVDQLNIIVSDLSLIHLTHDTIENIMFESLVGTDEDFEGISVSTIETIIIPSEEYCSFSNISTSNVIKDGRLAESILFSHNVPCAEQERNVLSVIQIDCSFVNVDEEEEMAELAFVTESHLLQMCATITPVELKPMIGTGNEVMAESLACGVPLGTTISGELKESCIPSFLGREDTREGPYLQSDDPPDSGFSPITYLEQCFIQSPDIFGIKADVSRKKRRMKHSASTSDQFTGPITRSRAKRLSAESEGSIVKFTANDTSTALDHLWRRTHYTAGESLIGTVAIICKALRLATIKSRNPIVTLEPDMTKLVTSMHPVTPFRLSLPRCEGSLESALMQYEAGVKCILEQVKSTRSIIENIRSTSHWTLHFLMDAQLYMLDIQYEIWEYLTRCVQLGVFSVYQCSLWETHHQLFDARMHCLLFEMNAAVALSSQAEMCSSYVRRFEEWNRKTNNFSSIYNNAHGLALSLIKHITIPNALTRLQSMTHWNSKERPYKSSEEVFFVDLVPFFEVGTCPFANADFDMEKFFLGAQSIERGSLENLIGDNVTQNNSANGFSFLFPSFAVLAICRNQIYKEVSSYFSNHIDELMHNDHYHLSLISPMSRAYVLSRFHETRAKFLMRNNIMNLSKIIAKLNSTFDELRRIVDKTGQVELDCPCGQVVFFFESGKVGVNINSLSTENVHVPDTVLAEEGRRIMGDCVKNTVFDPLTIIEQEKGNNLTVKHERMKKSIEIVKDWVMSVSSTYNDEVHCETTDVGVECVEPMEVIYPSNPAHVTVIEDVDDESDSLASVVLKQAKKKCCNFDTVTTTIAGRRIEYSVNCADGVLKMKTMDSLTDDTSTDNLSATNTITTASFNSFDQIETLKIIRSHETGELNWIAMIKNALDAIPAPKMMPAFLRRSGSSDCQIDVMKAHEHANHFVQELDENGEFIDQRKEQRERIRQFQHVDYFERKRNTSGTSLEFTVPKADERDKVPLYALWISEVVRYADIERKRMMQLRPINNVGRCRAARSEMIREFAIPCKRARRCNSTPPWFGRTVYEHYGDDLSLGMARLEYEISGRKMQPDPQIGSHDDAITHYFVSRNNSPSTMVDPLELLENPYSFFEHKPVAGRRILPPLVESSLVKKVCLYDPPIFAPFTSLKNEPETLYPPCDSDFDSSDDEL
ncbi:unnamed protein product [Angiostrongylus costaricensis]|uniref:Helitron_like_N domain-containing protein n=1 Tax=Angiostrongylus costaricensis TaxID=334426 RepID=A0A0R3PPF5_ANGCS|nr:unnamed protein product [Angiostrongylus costaricensis]